MSLYIGLLKIRSLTRASKNITSNCTCQSILFMVLHLNQNLIHSSRVESSRLTIVDYAQLRSSCFIKSQLKGL